MAQMEEQISRLLSDPQTAAQLATLSEALNGGNGQGAQEAAQENAPQQGANPSVDFAAILAAILANESLDPNIRALLAEIFGEERAPSEAEALLLALRPFLDAARQARLDQMLEVLKLSNIAQLAAQILKGGVGCV